jgi:hypothetical protein
MFRGVAWKEEKEARIVGKSSSDDIRGFGDILEYQNLA